MKRTKLFIISVLLVGSLMACETNSATPVEDLDPSPNEQVVEEPVNEPIEESNGNPVEPVKEPNGDKDDLVKEDVEKMNSIPERKELKVEVEGEIKKRVAHLMISELNYSLYVIEGYSLHAEEPGKDVLVFDSDEEFFIRIEPLGNVDAQEIEDQIVQYAHGAVQGGYNVPLADVNYSILEQVETETENKTLIHFAKDFNGNLIKFTLFSSSNEAAEVAEPHFWAMLNTLLVGEYSR